MLIGKKTEIKKQRNKCKKWDNFVTSIFFTLVLPLIPFGLDFLISIKNLTIDITSLLDIKSLVPMASFFILALGSSSRIKAFHSFSIVAGALLAGFYVSISSGQAPSNYIKALSWILIIFSILLHIIERGIRHVRNGETFLDFWYGKEEMKRLEDDIRRLEEQKHTVTIDMQKVIKELDDTKDNEEKFYLRREKERLKTRWREITEELLEKKNNYDSHGN